jgi:thiol-disulfide isomerase/thioredoxin
VVIGGGDSAAEEAMQLSSFAKNITILVRKDEMRASASMQDRLKKYPNIGIEYNKELVEIRGDGMSVTDIVVRDNAEDSTAVRSIDGVFLAIGHDPNTALIKGKVPTDQAGYILMPDRSQATQVKGVFAAGDVQDSHYRQAGVATGHGICAALDALSFLGEIGYVVKGDHKKFFSSDSSVRGDEHEAGHAVIGIQSLDAFENELQKAGSLPVFVDFYADYCPSCIALLPVYHELAHKYGAQGVFLSVNADVAADVVSRYSVSKLPCLLLFKEGKLVLRYVNALDRIELEKLMVSFF